MLDLFESRLEMAKKMGADHVLKITKGDTPEDVAKIVAERLGDMPDRTIECTGAESAIQTGIYVSHYSVEFIMLSEHLRIALNHS